MKDSAVMKSDIMYWLAFMVCLLLALTGCGAARPAAESLSLSSEQPTFIFFFTDN
jgi:hypothetical protein